jgi:hypothetical protein
MILRPEGTRGTSPFDALTLAQGGPQVFNPFNRARARPRLSIHLIVW